MRHAAILATTILCLASSAIGQEEEEPGGSPDGKEKAPEYPAGAVVVDLLADQADVAGTVAAWNDGESLHVEYRTTGSWRIHGTQMHAALDWVDVPEQNGNPTPGQFELKEEHGDDGVTVVTYEIQLSDEGWAPGDIVYVAAHAELSLMLQDGDIVEAGAWAEGDGFPGANWAMYFALEILAPEEETPPPQEEKPTEEETPPPEEEVPPPQEEKPTEEETPPPEEEEPAGEA
jgi:hypothetical protein